MSDSKKPSSIPQWQQHHQADATTNPTASNPSPNSDDPSATQRAALLEQTSKFLEDDSIRDAPTDRKVSFLESKGLRNDEIQSLLGVSRNTEASTDTPADDAKAPEEATSPSSPSDQTSQKSRPPAQSSPSPPSSSPSKTTTSRDVPPIITYPEFLFKESKKPPLVTFSGILYTLYGAAGLGASLYGASEYLVKPMLANLTSARHELADTASGNLKKLNEKLEQNVSTIPPHNSSSADADEEDSVSITSDPTELFHRDVATQTSPEVSSTPAVAATDKDVPDATAKVSSHIQRLESIRSHLHEFAESDSKSSDADDSVRMRLNEMRHYLDGLMYSKPSYTTTGYGMYTTMDTGSGTATGVARGEEDAISNFKSEIRGVKGALLSARNFPAGRGGRISGGVPLGR